MVVTGQVLGLYLVWQRKIVGSYPTIYPVSVNRSPFVSGRGFHWYDIGRVSAPNGKVICFAGVWDKGRFDAMEIYF